ENINKWDITEKIDGTNVRVTVRNHEVVRLEKRRNPSKIQKAKGITDPWYVDADEYDPQDKYIFEGIKNTFFENTPDGEWSGELVGKNIQGNPLNGIDNRIIFFSLGEAPEFENVPTTFDELKEWLPKQKSKYGHDCGIEGIVWHHPDGSMYKIKCKDFK
ncbi:MAG: hypothetical protein IH948_04160, partial [Bacteroidetes bacterium]|nr:hypothetical protein [Bacteroidota bacterium]